MRRRRSPSRQKRSSAARLKKGVMSANPSNRIRSAEDAALGFYYQAYFAFLTLLEQTGDDAGVGVERLDDVELKVDGHCLLYQLKHSIKAAPPH
jgi:hypothetical protein